MRQGSTLTYLHADHLGSASLSTDASGGKVSEMRYYAYGETRSGAMFTDRRYTGQRQEAGLGIYDYGARYYDPYLARFIQADTMVLNATNSQDLNRYSYARNNALRYKDPTGHFSEEEQLKKWFGDDWRSLFTEAWQNILLLAEFGDAVVYGDDEFRNFFLVSDHKGAVVAWNINPYQSLIGAVPLTDMYTQNANTDNIALFRPTLANKEGGPSSNAENIYAYRGPFECAIASSSYEYVAGSLQYGLEKTFKEGWNLDSVGGQLYQHVDGANVVAGFEQPSIWGWAGIGGTLLDLLKDGSGFGGPFGLFVSFVDMLTFDTSYKVTQNHPYPVPVPTPPVTTPTSP